jgi:predicted HicB family RNase H-like nuclease
MTKKKVERIEVAESLREQYKKQSGEPDLRTTNIRGIPGKAYKTLRVEAAMQEISINQLIVNILVKESKRIEKKGG